jgi:hypothetical protein
MNTLPTLRKRKAEDSPPEGQKSKHRKPVHPKDAPRQAKGVPLPKHGETMHPGSMSGIGSGRHPRDAPRQIEVRKSMLGIEPGGHPKDAPHRIEVKDAPLPKHGKRLFIQASLFWQNEYGRNRQCQGKFLIDSGCTGAILNAEFVAAHKMPWVRRESPVEVRSADGTPIEDAGSKYSTPLTMRIGHHQEEVSWEIGKLEKGISGYLPVEWLTKHNPEIDWETGVLKWRSQYCKSHCLPVSMRDAVRNFVRMLRESKVWETNGNSDKVEPSGKVGPSGKAAASAVKWHDEDGGDIAERLPERYRKWASVFSEEEINRLPDHTEYDHKIQLVDGAQPPFGPIYPLSEKELQALREYLRKELAAGKIRESKSPAGAPIIFVPKPDGSCHGAYRISLSHVLSERSRLYFGGCPYLLISLSPYLLSSLSLGYISEDFLISVSRNVSEDFLILLRGLFSGYESCCRPSFRPSGYESFVVISWL